MSETTKELTTRRALMGNAGVAALATVLVATPGTHALKAASAPSDADTPLLTLCNQFMALQAGVDRINADREHDHEEELERLCAAQSPILDEMEDLRAVSLEEHRARARVLMKWYGVKDNEEGHSQLEWHRVAPLFRDLLGEAA